jgi:hypothetical protein
MGELVRRDRLTAIKDVANRQGCIAKQYSSNQIIR